ncbi:MAG: GWxTD domain-containing protein [Candidatus Aminicenantes bacterium]|nr:GWxTD domain-containing protein [Candidatus Aminicenantes bacterium]MDH5467960.1 GWxTD domain-containing protein [Candidatus Aminicenantes bacterium]MDH5705812.1 GWxTD domain-containing protein [Candidatus Aminicenantes bacterium]
MNKLDPVSEEFYSKVRYIMTKEESKIFLELPLSARAEFIEEFWERRDPTPGTKENDYKEAYFTRIEEANRLFRGGGRPGWLQDRGRIYILFGPPNERQTNPMGGRNIDPYEDARDQTSSRQLAAGEKPSEIWIYYNLFSSLQKPQVVRIVFVDTYGTGDYQLISNLNELIPGMMGIETQFAPNLAYMHELSKEEAFRARLNLQKLLFDFSWELLKTKNKEIGSNLLIHIVLPYDKIVFAKENETLRAVIELDAVIKDSADKIIWQFEEEHNLNFREDYLIQNREGFWEMEIPVTKWLKKGNYSVYLSLKNLSGDQEIKKLLPLKI